MNNIWVPRCAYFTTGVLANLFVNALVLYYVQIDFSEIQIGLLASVSFLAALFQPIIGLVIDRSKSPKRIYQYIILFYILNIFIMSLTTNFYIYIILVFLTSISKLSFFALLDSIVIKSVNNYGGNFGRIRNFASIGFGVGMIVAFPFISNGDIYNFFYVSIIIGIINILAVQFIKQAPVKRIAEARVIDDVKAITSNKVVVLLIIANFTIFGIMNIKMSYQPLLLNSLDATPFMIAIASAIMTFPEIVIMPFLAKFRSKYSDQTLFVYAFVLTGIQLFLFSITKNVYLVLIIISFHGFANGIYIPLYSITLLSKVKDSVSSTALMFSITTQFLLSAVVSFIIITPVYVTFGISAVFFVLSLFTFSGALIILYIYKIDKGT